MLFYSILFPIPNPSAPGSFFRSDWFWLPSLFPGAELRAGKDAEPRGAAPGEDAEAGGFAEDARHGSCGTCASI